MKQTICKSMSLFAVLLGCSVTTVLTSCISTEDNQATATQTVEEEMKSQYGENLKITDGNYDKSLAVKCINGTFVGKKTEGVIAFKGIPFVGQQPVGDLRWKAPVDVVPDDGVYQAYYNAKSACQREMSSEKASYYVQGEDCLYLNVWQADETTDAKKPVMVWIHGGAFEYGGTVDPLYDCHILTKYYCI